MLGDFDFEKAQAIMVLLGITFPDVPGTLRPRHTPTVEELKLEAERTIGEAWEEFLKWPNQKEDEKTTGVWCWCGNMMVDISEECLSLHFIPLMSESYFSNYEENENNANNTL